MLAEARDQAIPLPIRQLREGELDVVAPRKELFDEDGVLDGDELRPAGEEDDAQG